MSDRWVHDLIWKTGNKAFRKAVLLCSREHLQIYKLLLKCRLMSSAPPLSLLEYTLDELYNYKNMHFGFFFLSTAWYNKVPW